MNLLNRLEQILLTLTKLSCIIKNLLGLLEQGFNKKYCWLTIRIQEKSNAYEIPRWHCDGNYFNKKSYPYPQTKFVMVLKGPSSKNHIKLYWPIQFNIVFFSHGFLLY